MPGSGWLVAGGRREASPTRRGDGTGRRGDMPAARGHRSVTGAATAAHYAVVKRHADLWARSRASRQALGCGGAHDLEAK
jgi:hypothetical protein